MEMVGDSFSCIMSYGYVASFPNLSTINFSWLATPLGTSNLVTFYNIAKELFTKSLPRYESHFGKFILRSFDVRKCAENEALPHLCICANLKTACCAWKHTLPLSSG